MKKYLVLFIALILGTFLRLYQLSEVPNGLTWDEAAIGYNAYSILKTGRDEHGALMPVIFKSFGDYKPGLYIYLTVPSVAVFGLNEFAVRFPSALAGVFAIYGVYLLVKILSEDKQKTINPILPSLTALAYAISPWSVHFSHGAWEVNVFVTFTIFALFYLLKFIKGRSSPYLSLLFVCLSLATYQAAKMLTPLLILLIVLIYWKSFWQRLLGFLNLRTIIYLLPFVLFGLWIILGSVFGKAGNRLTTLSIFNYKPEISALTKNIDNYNSTQTALFHNQTQLTTSLILSRYLWHFSPEVLFYEGSIISERGHIPNLGILNPLEFIWIILGLIYLAQNTSKKSTKIILGLLLIAPIPASLTLAEYSTVRALFMAVPLSIISGLGMYYLLKKSKILTTFIGLAYLVTTIYTFDVYYFHSQTVFAKEFNYGYKQAIQLIKDNPTPKVIFTDVMGQPYIYYVFYTAYNPLKFQGQDFFIDGGLDVGRVSRVGNVEFHQFGDSELNRLKNVMFIGSEGNINNQYDITGPNISLFKQIETPDHKIIFRVIKTKAQ